MSEPNHERTVVTTMTNRSIVVKVSFDLPFYLYLNNANYEIQTRSHKVTVTTRAVKQEHIDPRLSIEATDLELRNDRHGRIRYTKVELAIPGEAVIERHYRNRIRYGSLQYSGPINVHLGLDDLCDTYLQPAFEESLDAINCFIGVYREVTGNYYIRTVSENEIYRSTINWFEEDELLCGVERVRYGEGGVTLAPVLSPSREHQFRTRLMTHKPTSIIAELSMNARDYLELNNYRMAVIESRTCIEVLVDLALSDYFARTGITIEEAKKLLKIYKVVRCETIDDVLKRAEINVKLKRGFKRAIGKSLAEKRTLWQKWLRAKTNRENAVHKGADISAADARESVSATLEIINLVAKELNVSEP